MKNKIPGGLAANILIPVALCLALNGLIFSVGWGQQDNGMADVWFAPPGWFVGAVWTVLYVFYGISRWHAARAGKHEAHLVTALIIWGLAYPFLTGGFEAVPGAVLNVVSLALTMFVILRIHAQARRAALWLLPSALWESFAVVLGFAALS